jgi:hypothetical protein
MAAGTVAMKQDIDMFRRIQNIVHIELNPVLFEDWISIAYQELSFVLFRLADEKKNAPNKHKPHAGGSKDKNGWNGTGPSRP